MEVPSSSVPAQAGRPESGTRSSAPHRRRATRYGSASRSVRREPKRTRWSKGWEEATRPSSTRRAHQHRVRRDPLGQAPRHLRVDRVPGPQHEQPAVSQPGNGLPGRLQRAASAHHPARARGTRDTYLVRLRPGESRDLTSAIGLVGAHQHLAEPGLAQVTQGADQVPVAVTDDDDPHLPR